MSNDHRHISNAVQPDSANRSDVNSGTIVACLLTCVVTVAWVAVAVIAIRFLVPRGSNDKFTLLFNAQPDTGRALRAMPRQLRDAQDVAAESGRRLKYDLSLKNTATALATGSKAAGQAVSWLLTDDPLTPTPFGVAANKGYGNDSRQTGPLTPGSPPPRR